MSEESTDANNPAQLVHEDLHPAAAPATTNVAGSADRGSLHRPSDERNGHFLDSMWCCKVCDGEIPDGHTDNCDIWKLEKKHRDFLANEYNAVLMQRDKFQAALTKVHGIVAEYWGPCMGSVETLLTIRDVIPDAKNWLPKVTAPQRVSEVPK